MSLKVSFCCSNPVSTLLGRCWQMFIPPSLIETLPLHNCLTNPVAQLGSTSLGQSNWSPLNAQRYCQPPSTIKLGRLCISAKKSRALALFPHPPLPRYLSYSTCAHRMKAPPAALQTRQASKNVQHHSLNDPPRCPSPPIWHNFA